MNYSDTLDFLYSSLPMYQRIGKAAYKSNLDTTLRLDNHLGKPHRSFRSIHIAGTNGKGSVSHMLAAVLQDAGYKTGLYTSPHYIDFRERIRVDGKMVDEQYVIDFVRENMDILMELEASFFEMTVAMAFSYFEKEKVDMAIVETGMGGRLDSTNIITPLVSVITGIGFDHTQYLGDTLEKIAMEKAGIIKQEVPVVIGQAGAGLRKLFEDRAIQMHAPIYFAEDRYTIQNRGCAPGEGLLGFDVYRDGMLFLEELCTDLLGDFQALNIRTVLQVVELLEGEISGMAGPVREGLMKVKKLTGFMGRWQVMRQSPLVICDSGHNADGLATSVRQLLNMKHDRLHMVIGMVNDKDISAILDMLPADAKYYFTRATIPRALDQDILRSEAEKYSLEGSSYPSVIEAYRSAMDNADKKDIIFVGGSSFVVADFLRDYESA
ncbi:MAG: folylpolyglutamate synthase/dihydrofolate synthase family protein [Bacteroidales bacterium]|jgi:dihydrofolate synthase/folylpolyglutamate synthase|nr:folylpolyglutamate synthase/dihydrofolate synthase family protein [Bacteroidales bacterium]